MKTPVIALSLVAMALVVVFLAMVGCKAYDSERAAQVQAERKEAAALQMADNLARCKAGKTTLIMVQGVMCK